MSERKFASTSIRDSEDKLGLTPEGVNQLLADTNTTAAKTKGFTQIGDVDFPEGLIFTSLIKLLDAGNNGDEMAGVSGIQGALKNNPAFWAGGSYEQAFALIQFLSKMSAGTAPAAGEYDNLAKIILLHNGAARVGDFIVEQTGRIVMVDPATGKPRLVFSVQNLNPLADLMYNADAGGSVTNFARQTQTSLILTNTMNVSRDNSKITIPSSAVSVYHASNNDEGTAQSYATISLLHNGNFYAVLGAFDAGMPIGYTEDNVDFSTNALTLDGCPAGTYSIKITITSTSEVYSKLLTIGDSSMSWSFTKSGVRYFQFGVNGMMAFFSENHWYFSEQEGFDLRGKTNMPGVLAAGSVDSGGAQTNVWGAKSSPAGAGTISGGRIVPLANMNHSNYVVQITPHTATTFRVGTKTTSSFQAIGTGGFDYVVIGNNY